MVSISRRFKDYEIIVNAVSFLMVLVEFFVYRAVGFIHSAAYAVLGISSMAALVLYLLYKDLVYPASAPDIYLDDKADI